jgi:hypothetical protein
VRGRVPVRVTIDAVVDHEVLSEHLREDPLALEPSPRHSLERVNARGVNKIERDPEHLSDADRAVRRLTLDLWRA